MFDYHIHTSVSFDSEESPEDVVKEAEKLGLREICFTDHHDLNGKPDGVHYLFTIEDYNKAYDKLTSKKVKIRRGIEMGLTLWNKEMAEKFISMREFDFVLGSVHYAGGYDPYFAEFWEGINFRQGVDKYLKDTFECVKLHDNFDVLGHLTYVCKSTYNPEHKAIPYSEVSDMADEIMKCLVSKGKGMEINTSGVDKAGDFLPSLDYLRRFRELGGEIVTIGSDAHDTSRLGQYSKEALSMAKEVFGYVCTFEKRKPIFHKL